MIPAGQTINMAYLLDGGSPIQEPLLLTSNFLPGNTIDFVFSQTESVQTGQWYEFTVFTDYQDDVKPWNDTLIREVGVFEAPIVDLGPDYQVITDLQHTLDAGPGFVSYEWQDESTNQTFVVTEPGIGIYGVTVTDNNGCTVYEEVEIMLAVPDIGILEVVHPKTTCSLGDSEYIQLAIKNFGNWDIEQTANIIVAYSLNGALAVVEHIVLDTLFENGSVIYHTFASSEDFSSPDRYDIMAFTEYGSDLIPSNDNVLVSVDVLGSPVIDIGNGEDSILVYDPLTLSATPGYVSYQWQDGSTDPDYDITEPSAELYSVLVTADNECSTRDSVYVAYDLPDIGVTRIVSPVSACELDQKTPVYFEIMNNGYYRISTEDTITITYSVDSGSPIVEEINLTSELQPGQTRVLTFSTRHEFSGLGSYQLDVDLDYAPDENLSNNDHSSTINVWGFPQVEIGGGQDTIITELPYSLDAGGGYTSYLWQDNSTNSWFDVTQYGLYWVRITDQYGCSDQDSVYIDSETHTNNISAVQGQIHIYPNPVQDILNVDVEFDSEKEVILEIYTVVNTLVYKKDPLRTKLARTEIDVNDLAPGSYIVRITVDQIPHTTMVIVE
jgi:hypothetical protein